MFTHWFAFVMVGTFIAAIATLLLGVAGIGHTATTAQSNRSTRLMALRVGLCALLLLEIIVYILYFKS